MKILQLTVIQLLMLLLWSECSLTQLINSKSSAGLDKFVIDHMGRMGTTLSPKEQQEVAEMESDDYYSELYSSPESQESEQAGYDDYQGNEVDTEQGGPVSSSAGQQDLMAKCAAEGGTCTSFTGCDTVSRIYKGYCTTDYSSVCCVSRDVICEKNDGICTDDREACLAAGEIMGKKYNLRFYTWMDCNSTFVCCRPSRKTNLFSVGRDSNEPLLSVSSEKSSSPGTATRRQARGGKMVSNKKDRAGVSSRNRARQLGKTTRTTKKKRMSKTRLSKLSRGAGMEALPGFPNKDIVSPLYEEFPEENRQVSRKTSNKKSLKRQTRKQTRLTTDSELLQALGLSPLQPYRPSYPPVVYSPQTALSRLGYSPLSSSLQTALSASPQRPAYSPYSPPLLNTASLARGLSPVQNSLQSAASPSHSSHTDHLTKYHSLTDLPSPYTSHFTNPALPQQASKTAGHLASPPSLFGNIYLKK